MAKLWQKGSVQQIDPIVEKYTVGTDYLFDMQLMPFDIVATKAHARGLESSGILSPTEVKKVVATLSAMEKDIKEGKIKITREDEDCHTVIENYLIEKLGVIGKKVHTGRSRNDQVLVAVRLYMKSHLATIKTACVELASEMLDFTEEHRLVPMAGYSHTQQAMLSSVGHYFSAYAESLLDDAAFLDAALKQLDKNPLGSAAGFGTALPIDRMFTTKELGFGSVQINSLYCQNSRGKFESVFLEGLSQVMLTLGKVANDLIIFTSQEFDYFAVEQSLTTGSSIMPQKRNMDPLEILRGNVSVVMANQMMIKDISKSVLSGYNRDLQLLKKPLFESVEVVTDSLAVMTLVMQGIEPKTANIEAKITKGIFAADVANKLVTEKNIPFRDAYKQALDILEEQPINYQQNIASKKTIGAAGNLQLNQLRARAKKLV